MSFRSTACASADERRLEPFYADRAGLELGGSRLGIPGVDRQQVGVDLVGEVEGHERESGTQAGNEPQADPETQPEPEEESASPDELSDAGPAIMEEESAAAEMPADAGGEEEVLQLSRWLRDADGEARSTGCR